MAVGGICLLILFIIMALLYSVRKTFEIVRLSARPLKHIPMLLGFALL
jgi:hypothetical protein